MAATLTRTTTLALGLGKSKALVACSTLAEASGIYRAAADQHMRAGGHGFSDFHEGRVYDTSGAKPKVVARISWNGKVWANKRWEMNDQPLFDPYAQEAGAR